MFNVLNKFQSTLHFFRRARESMKLHKSPQFDY